MIRVLCTFQLGDSRVIRSFGNVYQHIYHVGCIMSFYRIHSIDWDRQKHPDLILNVRNWGFNARLTEQKPSEDRSNRRINITADLSAALNVSVISQRNFPVHTGFDWPFALNKQKPSKLRVLRETEGQIQRCQMEYVRVMCDRVPLTTRTSGSGYSLECFDEIPKQNLNHLK